MITVQNAREITEKAIQEEINSRQVRAEKFCETISKDIEAQCSAGKSELTVVDIDRKIYSYVISIVKSFGFKVVMLNNTSIHIIW